MTRTALLSLLCCAASGCRSEPAREMRPEAPPAEAPAPVASAPEEPVPEQGRPTPAPQEPAAEPAVEPQATGDVAPSPQAPQEQTQTPPQAQPQPQPQAQSQWPEKPAEGEHPAPSPETPPAHPGWIHGSLGLRYRGRFTGDDSDNDARAVLALDLADPGTPWITGHVLARMDVDLDSMGGQVFQDLADTYDGSVVSKLYLAYADVALDSNPAEAKGTLRIGRQTDPYLPEVLRLDGITYQSKPIGKHELGLGVYGGVPVHLYESSHEGDLAFGTFVEGVPWHGGRARFDWMHLDDELVLGDQRNDLLSLGLWQDVSARWRMEGELSHLEGDLRDLRLRTFYDDADSQTLLRASYYELLQTQTTRVTELDPFTEQLLDYFPYRQGTVGVSRAFGAHTTVDAGIDVRRVSDSGDVGEFNRDWERYYATATLHDLPEEGVALSVTADRWNDDDRDTSSLGADLSYAAEKRWKTAIGSYYSLYKYELLELAEREDVRTYYLRMERELSRRLVLDLLYEFEDDDLDTYHTLRLGALWRF